MVQKSEFHNNKQEQQFVISININNMWKLFLSSQQWLQPVHIETDCVQLPKQTAHGRDITSLEGAHRHREGILQQRRSKGN